MAVDGKFIYVFCLYRVSKHRKFSVNATQPLQVLIRMNSIQTFHILRLCYSKIQFLWIHFMIDDIYINKTTHTYIWICKYILASLIIFCNTMIVVHWNEDDITMHCEIDLSHSKQIEGDKKSILVFELSPKTNTSSNWLCYHQIQIACWSSSVIIQHFYSSNWVCCCWPRNISWNVYLNLLQTN